MTNIQPHYTNPIQNTVYGPYRCVNMVLKIYTASAPSGYVLGVVEGADIQLDYKGSADPVYGCRIPIISLGAYEVTFTITRWYFADDSQKDLLLNLFASETSFSLSGQLYDNTGTSVSNSKLTITGCKIMKYRPKTGAANDIIGEEASGSGTNWDLTGFIQETTP